MLKIVDSAGKKVGELKDDDSAPIMIAGEILPAIKDEDEEKDCQKPEEGETEDGSDVR